MASVFKKLNLKDQAEIVVVNSPASFEPELASLEGVNIVRDTENSEKIGFSLAFVTKQDEVNTLAAKIAAKAQGDALVWFAYPKGSSKNYTCEFNRDTGWAALGEAGFEAVRQVAIDADWSALRFRRIEHIKSFQREAKRAMTAKGKKRAAGE